jgi:IclR family pca regulon transcriptional regulator
MGELSGVRAQGFAVVDQEVELGLRSVAVPILDVRGKAVAALNLGLSAIGETADDLPHLYLPALLHVQREVSRVLR